MPNPGAQIQWTSRLERRMPISIRSAGLLRNIAPIRPSKPGSGLVGTGSVASHWASSETRAAGGEPGVERERRTLLRNQHGHWQPKSMMGHNGCRYPSTCACASMAPGEPAPPKITTALRSSSITSSLVLRPATQTPNGPILDFPLLLRDCRVTPDSQ